MNISVVKSRSFTDYELLKIKLKQKLSQIGTNTERLLDLSVIAILLKIVKH